jgi:cation transport ATPase
MLWCFALIVTTIEGDRKTGKTVGYVYYGATLAGIFSLSDSCRTGVAEAIKELKSLGIRTAMLTGDSEAAAMYAQEQVKLLSIIVSTFWSICVSLQTDMEVKLMPCAARSCS